MPAKVDFVIDGVVAAMAHPGAGGALRHRLKQLSKAGVDAIVSLSISPPDARTIKKARFRHLHVPVDDFSAPSVDDFDRTIAFIDSVTDGGGAAAVHCTSGYGRTGTVLAGYLVAREGLTAEDAISRVRQRRPGSIETDGQEAAVAQYETILKTRAVKSDLDRRSV